MNGLASFVTGFLFAVGLSVAGMTSPDKVIGFLNVAGSWDPSLAFVMIGAIGVYAPVWVVMRKRGRALSGKAVAPVAHGRLDPRLIGGAAVFGLGWGIAGFCPGPALAAAGTLAPSALLMAFSMLIGMIGYTRWMSPRM